jgi:hypothetical protein
MGARRGPVPDLTLVHEYQSDGAAEVELGIKVWAQLLVQRLRQQGGAPAPPPDSTERGRPT